MSDLAEERGTVIAAYGLFLLGVPTSGLTALIGVILAHLKLDAVRGSLYESHYRNMILVFWVWLAVALAAAMFTLMGLTGVALSVLQAWPGRLVLFHGGLLVSVAVLAAVLVCLWYYWRLLRGLMYALDDKPY